MSLCLYFAEKMNSGQSFLLFFLHLTPHLFGLDRCSPSMITEKEKYKHGAQVSEAVFKN